MMQKTPQILVVDDDPDLRELLGRYLSAQGFEVTAVEDGAAMDTFLATHSTDLIILDLMLPGEDGLSIAKRLRSDGDTPIIMLSARGEEVDRIVGLEVGADDYLSKPFNPRELLARIRAVLRRPTATPLPICSRVLNARLTTAASMYASRACAARSRVIQPHRYTYIPSGVKATASLPAKRRTRHKHE